MTDYQRLQAAAIARANPSDLPRGLTDYQHLRTAPIAATTRSEVPRGLTGYQELYTEQLRPNYSAVSNGLTVYQRLAR